LMYSTYVLASTTVVVKIFPFCFFPDFSLFNKISNFLFSLNPSNHVHTGDRSLSRWFTSCGKEINDKALLQPILFLSTCFALLHLHVEEILAMLHALR
jgi:hypothetical protein